MAFSLPVVLFNQSQGQRLLLPVPLLNQSARTAIALPVPIFNQSVAPAGSLFLLPIPLFNQSGYPGLVFPRPIFNQTPRAAYQGPDLPLPLINQSAPVVARLPLPIIANPTDIMVGILPMISVEIIIPTMASISGSVPVVRSSGFASVTNLVTVNAALLVPTASIQAGGSDITASLLGITSSMDVVVGLLGIIESGHPVLRSEITASSAGIVVVEGPLGVPRVDIEARIGIDARIPSATVSIPIGVIDTWAGLLAAIEARLPAPKADLAGYFGVDALIDGELPLLTQIIAAGLPPDYARQIVALTMNTKTYALSEYLNYPFTSFCRFKGFTLAACKDGLFMLDTTNRDTYLGGFVEPKTIPAKVVFGKLDFESEHIKTVERLYIGARTEDAMLVTVTADEKDPVEYEMEHEGDTTIKARRVKLGKGERGKYWQIQIENQNGADFEIDSVDVGTKILGRRV